jgi:sugar (pentulose or hexulose) kinase
VDLSLYIGIDIGTSGCRAIAINDESEICGQAVHQMPPPTRNKDCIEQDPLVWQQCTLSVLTDLSTQINGQCVKGIAVDATSGTVLLADTRGNPLTPGLLYNDSRAKTQATKIHQYCHDRCAAHGPSSSLAKLLWFQAQGIPQQTAMLMHQADWITTQLGAPPGKSDTNNCMKLGFDAVENRWPAWFDELGVALNLLPRVVAPGTVLGTLKTTYCETLGFPPDTQLLAGTTDSTAAFMASEVTQTGHAVTALGSTLVVKVLSDRPVYDSQYGIYSQPLFIKPASNQAHSEHWLVGGASNSGAAVLLKYFTIEQINHMTDQLRPDRPTKLDYYPLCGTGERFPINDPELKPRLSPRPKDDIQFFQGMLEGIAAVEHQAYRRLSELGAPYPTQVSTNGGGSSNAAWSEIRRNYLNVPIHRATHDQAAFGSALLVKNSLTKRTSD